MSKRNHTVTAPEGYALWASFYDQERNPLIMTEEPLALSHFTDLRQPIAECSRVLRPGGHLLLTDFHPQAIKNGWEPTFVVGDDAYILPHPAHDRTDYLGAVTLSGCDLVHVEEVLVREQPPESLMVDDVDAFLREHGDWPMCLIVLGRRR